MRKLFSITAFSILSLISFCQTDKILQPYLEGHKVIDTVKMEDFNVGSSRLTLDSKEYKVVGFTLLVWAGIVREYKSDSCGITNEMKSALEELKTRGFKTSKIYFHEIRIKNKNGEEKITGDVVYKIKLK